LGLLSCFLPAMRLGELSVWGGAELFEPAAVFVRRAALLVQLQEVFVARHLVLRLLTQGLHLL